MDNELVDGRFSLIPHDCDPNLPTTQWLYGFLATDGQFVATYRNDVPNCETIRTSLLKCLDHKLENGDLMGLTQAMCPKIKLWRRWYGELEDGRTLTQGGNGGVQVGRGGVRNAPEYQVNCFMNHVLPILNYLGLPWNHRDANWMKHYNALVVFVEEHHHTQVNKAYQVGGVNLGQWVKSIRCYPHHHNKGQRRELLDEIDFEWSQSPGNNRQTRERMNAQHASGNTGANTGAFAYLFRDMDRHIRVLIEYEKVFHHVKLPYPYLDNQEARDQELLRQTKPTYLWLRKVIRARNSEEGLPPEIEEALKKVPNFHFWYPSLRSSPWSRIENRILDHLVKSGYTPTYHDVPFIDGDGRRPDLVYVVQSQDGTGIIVVEVDERMHDSESIESEQKKQTVMVLHGLNDMGAFTFFYVRINVGYQMTTDVNQMNTLTSVIDDCKDKIADGSKHGAHMIMIDYPSRHYHVNANRERVVPDLPGVELEMKKARTEDDYELPLFDSFELKETDGFAHGHMGEGIASLREEEDVEDEGSD